VSKKRSGVLERADHVASVGQRVVKELVDHIRTRKQSAAGCQGRERRRPFRLAALLLEDQNLTLRVGCSPRADESLDQIARAMWRHGGVAPALHEQRLVYLTKVLDSGVKLTAAEREKAQRRNRAVEA